MYNNLAYDPELSDTEVRNNWLCCEVPSKILKEFWILLNLTLIVLQPIPPLCDYKVWIDTERGAQAKSHLRNMIELNMMEEFRACRIVERKRAAYFVM
jgi:hypothetical protein